MMDKSGKEISNLAHDDAGQSVNLRRRALIKGGVTAMPAILTLQSGAALARSSNLISASSTETVDGLYRTLCLDTNTVEYADGTGRVFDLQEPPRPATVNIIERGEYRREANMSSPVYTAGEACELGGTFHIKPEDGPWREINIPPLPPTGPRTGAVVSSGAMFSMSDHIIENLI